MSSASSWVFLEAGSELLQFGPRELLEAVRGNAIAQPGFSPFSDVVFELLPILPVVTDLLAVRANREQPPQSLDACQRFFQLGSARNQASLRPDGAYSHLESGTQLFAAKGSSGSKPQPRPPFAEGAASRRHSPKSFIGGFPFPLDSGSCEWGLRGGTNYAFRPCSRYPACHEGSSAPPTAAIERPIRSPSI